MHSAPTWDVTFEIHYTALYFIQKLSMVKPYTYIVSPKRYLNQITKSMSLFPSTEHHLQHSSPQKEPFKIRHSRPSPKTMEPSQGLTALSAHIFHNRRRPRGEQSPDEKADPPTKYIGQFRKWRRSL